MKKPVKLTSKQKELLTSLQKEKKQEIKQFGEYAGFAIPTNHPRNELTPKESRYFAALMRTAQTLVKKKVLVETSFSRDVIGFDEVA